MPKLKPYLGFAGAAILFALIVALMSGGKPQNDVSNAAAPNPQTADAIAPAPIPNTAMPQPMPVDNQAQQPNQIQLATEAASAPLASASMPTASAAPGIVLDTYTPPVPPQQLQFKPPTPPADAQPAATSVTAPTPGQH
ncbi:MAG TPA: hypothetical protein VF509_11950 [Sphingobium sp.]